jgi:hypothetical protein
VDDAVGCKDSSDWGRRRFGMVVFVLEIEFGTKELAADFVNGRLYVVGRGLEFDS